jgi:hypothetical protein
MSDAQSTPSLFGEAKEATTPMVTTFTERETKVCAAALVALKNGPPEVDFALLMKYGDFNTMKTTQNVWGTLKKKLASIGDGSVVLTEGTSDCLPQNARADLLSAPITPKKRTKKDVDDSNGDGADNTVTKKAKKTPHKKKDRAIDGEGNSSGSPIKSSRKSSAKKTPKSKAIVQDDAADEPVDEPESNLANSEEAEKEE